MARKIVIDFELKYKEAAKNLDEFQKEYGKLEKQVQDQNASTAKSVKNIEGASNKAVKGIKAIGISIKAIGIGLLIAAFSKLKEVFEQNQVVADAFAVGFEFVSQVLNQVVTALVNTYTAVAKSSEGFDALGKVLMSLLTLSITPLKLAFYGIKLGLQEAQLAWEDSFFGGNDQEKIKQLRADIILTKLDLYGVAGAALDAGKEIYNNFGEAVGELGNIGSIAIDNLSKVSLAAAFENAKLVVDLNKAAAIAAVLQQGLIEKYDRQAEKIRQVRDEERNTIEERIKANNDLKAVLDEQEAAMLKLVDVQIAAAQLEYNKLKNQENYIALLEATQEREAVLAQIEGFRSEQLSNDLALNREKLELNQSIIDSDTERAIKQNEFLADQIEGEYLRLEALRFVAQEEAKLEEERLINKRDNYKEGTQAFADAQNELLGFQQENNQKQIVLEQNLNQAKVDLTTQALGQLAGIVGQNSKFGKGIALVQAIRDTFAGANKALSSAPPPFNFISAAAVIAGGLANVKAITSTKEPTAPSFARGAGGGSASVSIPTPPSFNIVGTSGTNQLAETLAKQTKEPVKAYVVSGDVTTAQSMERNIISSASI